MEYQIALTKYELNRLIDSVRNQLKKEQERFRDFCRSGDMVGADLQSDTVTGVTMLLGKLTEIPQKGDK
jgi:hypothetical protein